MCLGDIVNKLHNQYSFSDTSTTEKTNLTSLSIWGKQIDDLDTSDQKLGSSTLILEGGGISMDWQVLVCLDWASLIDWLSDDIDNSAEGLWSDWHHNRSSSISDFLTSNESFSRIQGNGTHVVSTEMLSDLKDESIVDSLDLEGIQNWRKVALELHIDDGTNDL